MIHNF